MLFIFLKIFCELKKDATIKKVVYLKEGGPAMIKINQTEISFRSSQGLSRDTHAPSTLKHLAHQILTEAKRNEDDSNDHLMLKLDLGSDGVIQISETPQGLFLNLP